VRYGPKGLVVVARRTLHRDLFVRRSRDGEGAPPGGAWWPPARWPQCIRARCSRRSSSSHSGSSARCGCRQGEP